MPQDILLNTDFSLRIENGDFAVGESTYQHQRLLLLCDKGEFKESPRTGVGIFRYLEDHDTEGLAREIREQFVNDGMTGVRINSVIPNINIEAEYENG